MQTLGPFYVNFSDLPDDLDTYTVPVTVDPNLIVGGFALLLENWDNINNDSSLSHVISTGSSLPVRGPTTIPVDDASTIFSPSYPYTAADWENPYFQPTLSPTTVQLTYHNGTAPSPPTQGRVALYYIVQPFTHPS